MNHRNAFFHGRMRIAKRYWASFHFDRPGIGLMAAADNAHQRRLARAVLANERVDFAAKDIEFDAFNGVDAAEALVDAGKGDLQNARVPARPVRVA
jgi:hypothetical protein